MINNYLFICSFFLIPYILEFYLTKQQNEGNYALYGIFLEIYINRNLVWLCSGLSLLLTFFKYTGFGILILSISLIKYFTTIRRWRNIF